MQNIRLNSDSDRKKVVINLKEKKEYSGFSSQVGVEEFGAPANWKATEVEFKYNSEHTVNEKRFGLEM